MFDVWVCIRRYGGIEMHMMCILECFFFFFCCLLTFTNVIFLRNEIGFNNQC